MCSNYSIRSTPSPVMGDVPSKEMCDSTTDIDPSQPPPLEDDSDFIPQPPEPEITDTVSMAGSLADIQHEPTTATRNPNQELLDYEVRSKSIDMEEQNARAQLDDILKRKEELQAAKKASILRRARQQNFCNLIDKSVITELRDRALVDSDLQKAIQVIAGGRTDHVNLNTLKNCLIEQLIGTEVKDWVLIAKKVLEIKKTETPKTSSAVQSSFAHDDAAQDACADRAAYKNETATVQPAADDPSKDLSSVLTEAADATVNGVARSPKKRGPQTSTEVDEIAKLNSDGFAVNKELTSSHEETPASPADKRVPQTPVAKSTIKSIPFIKSEDTDSHALLTPPSAKRQKLTEIEKTKEPPQLNFSFNELSPHSVSGTDSPINKRMPPPTSAHDDTHPLSSPASISRASVARSDVGSKRSRDEVAASSPSSTISINQTPKISTAQDTKRCKSNSLTYFQADASSSIKRRQAIHTTHKRCYCQRRDRR